MEQLIVKSSKRLISKQDWEMTVYPNPVSQGIQPQIRIHSNHFIYEKQVYVQIFSIDGKSVYQQTYSNGSFNLDVSTLVSGMYIVNIRTEDGNVYNAKMAVQ